MFKKLKQLASTHTIRQSSITMSATFASAGLGAIFYLILAKFLGAQEYGLLTLALTLFSLAVTIIDSGMGPGLVRFVGANRETQAYFPFAKIALYVKTLLGSICALIAIIFPTQLAMLFFHKSEVAPLIPIVGLAVLFQLLLSFSLSLFQGLQKFFLWGTLQVGANLLRLILFLGLFLLFKATSLTAIWVFFVAIFFSFVVSWIWIDKKIIVASITGTQAREFWNFSKWTSAFMAVSSLVSRLDIVFVGRFLSLGQIGVYGLAVTMSSFLPQLSTAVGAVTSTKFAGFSEGHNAHIYLKKSTLFALAVSLVVSVIMVPVALFVVWFTGKDFSASIGPFLILLAGMIVFIFTNPMRDSILYFHKKPQFFFWANLGQGAVISAASLIFIPMWGIYGAAFSMFLSLAFQSSVSAWYYLRLR